jgi:hypothetical protein
MATESAFYLEQVENCARDAEAALLPNRREMHLRSQAAWQALADRRILTEANRAKSEEQKRLTASALADQ